jgi:hypothetical protein
MWRYPFLNLCFVILILTLLSLQHSATVFGPTAHGWVVTGDDPSEGYVFTLFGESPRSLRVPAEFSDAAGLLHSAWRRAMVFNEWLMEYNASQWKILSASSPAETDLIEAKFHVINAEVFTQAMRENERAIKELARAETSLQAAQTIVKANLAAQLTTVREEIRDAEVDEQSEKAFSTVPFETIKANLDHLIHVLHLSKT